MTEADEKLSRVFTGAAPERDVVFANAVEERLKSARLSLLIGQVVTGAVLATTAAIIWFAWRTVSPVIAEALGAGELFQFDIMGAPAPALVVGVLAGAWLALRRYLRRLA